jgi:hypothetical protein
VYLFKEGIIGIEFCRQIMPVPVGMLLKFFIQPEASSIQLNQFTKKLPFGGGF